MTHLTTKKKTMLVLLVAALLLSALPTVAFAAAGDLVRFRVENRADRGITVRLYSQDGTGRAYYMRIEAGTTKDMTPIKGIYDYRLTACGVMVRGELDLNKPVNWIMPQCGDKGGPGTSAPNTQDIGKILKLQRVKLVNRTGSNLKIWFDGPFQYVFNIPSGGTKTVSILKGTYEWGHFACGGERTDGFIDIVVGSTQVYTCD